MHPVSREPDQLLDQELTATAFKAHPYRHPTIGWISDLQAMSRDDLYDYYRRHYVPNNAVLSIVGGFETDDALELVERFFGAIPKRGVPPFTTPSAPPPPRSPRRRWRPSWRTRGPATCASFAT